MVASATVQRIERAPASEAENFNLSEVEVMDKLSNPRGSNSKKQFEMAWRRWLEWAKLDERQERKPDAG